MATHYRASARRAAPHEPLRVYALDRKGRWGVLLLCLACVVFFAFLAPLAAERSHLRCERASSEAPRCTHERHYLPGLDADVALGALTSARVTYTRGRRGANAVLVLEQASGERTMVQGVGPSGVRAARVAADVNSFLADPARARGRWLLREGSLIASLVLLAGGVFFGALGAASQRSAVLTLRARERVVLVRDALRRRGTERALPLDGVTSVAAVPANVPRGVAYVVRIACEPACDNVELPLKFQSYAQAHAVAVAVRERLERWRSDEAAAA